MSFFLKTHVSQNEEARIKMLNKQIKKLNEHEIKVRRILDRFKKEDKKLHFAFFFAICSGSASYTSSQPVILPPPRAPRSELLAFSLIIIASSCRIPRLADGVLKTSFFLLNQAKSACSAEP